VHKQLRGDTAGTADTNWPKGCITATKTEAEEEEGAGGGFLGGQCSETGWATVCLWQVVRDFLWFGWFLPFPLSIKLSLA